MKEEAKDLCVTYYLAPCMNPLKEMVKGSDNYVWVLKWDFNTHR